MVELIVIFIVLGIVVLGSVLYRIDRMDRKKPYGHIRTSYGGHWKIPPKSDKKFWNNLKRMNEQDLSI